MAAFTRAKIRYFLRAARDAGDHGIAATCVRWLSWPDAEGFGSPWIRRQRYHTICACTTCGRAIGQRCTTITGYAKYGRLSCVSRIRMANLIAAQVVIRACERERR